MQYQQRVAKALAYIRENLDRPTELPIGSHFAAKPGEEKKLFDLAYQLEEASPWLDRLPL